MAKANCLCRRTNEGRSELSVIEVRLIGGLSVLMGTKHLRVQVYTESAPALLDLLTAIQHDYPKLAARLINDDGLIDPEIVVVIAGETMNPQLGLNTPLVFGSGNQDVPDVMFIPPVIGG